MNHTQMTARVGLFFLIGLALIWVTYEALHNGTFSRKDGYTVTAAFSTLKELKPGDPVRMAGVQVGTVESTRLARGRAEALLRISPDVEIAKDSTASIAMAGLLGSNYVSLTLGHIEMGAMAAGGEMHTIDAADINQIINDLGNLGQDVKSTLNQIGAAIGSGADGQGGLFQKLDRLVTENSSKISNTLTNLEQITQKINQGEGTLGRMVNDPEAYQRLLGTIDEIKLAASDARTFLQSGQAVMDQVRSGKGAVGTLLYDENAAENLRYTVKNLRDVSDKLNNPNSTFGQLITNDELIKDLRGTLKKADRALEGLGDQAPITAVGVAAQSLF